MINMITGVLKKIRTGDGEGRESLAVEKHTTLERNFILGYVDGRRTERDKNQARRAQPKPKCMNTYKGWTGIVSRYEETQEEDWNVV